MQLGCTGKLPLAQRLAVTMQLGVGSARVPRAADGVPPLASLSHCPLAVWWFSQVGERLWRDAANHTPEARAPHFQLNGCGLQTLSPTSKGA